MAGAREHTLDGIVVREWRHERPRYLALVVHGYGEHIGRYEELAGVLHRHGAAVFGPDHRGHGKSAGERVLIQDFEDVVTDVHTVAGLARGAYPDLPVVVVGHSMGGLISARYAQRHGAGLTALALSGPVIGDWHVPRQLIALDEIPDTPIDPATLSRDPSVGAAYVADPLVWHGPMKRPTVESFLRTLEVVGKGGDVGRLPLLWLHGDDDRLVPPAGSRIGVEQLSGGVLTERIYPGARHEVFNETNRAEVFADLTGFLDDVLDG
ncbi:alpha/beta hydrolase [Streptomyces sp. S.PB5]|uniref:alpha/beta hydrolase n=1 Tax=Streptomyces sp. S.PB5 TaxID=3020844 RepID=UPI0025B22E7C|nr:alpha/beta hydrolase [Streptomyces sp. S.PB5]MDN3025523.1 lysophospholipase [Streptomyces sp. S.PB5]